MPLEPAVNRPPPALDEDLDLSGQAMNDERLSRIVDHPDGIYWVAPDGHQEFGPFDTVEEALADMEADDTDSAVEVASLSEAEDDLGLSQWIDPDTGSLAEDTATRLEDH
jgi:hypothetical protein